MKSFLRKFVLTKAMYQKLKEIRDVKRYERASDVEKIFIDRSKHRKVLCMILAGYKTYLYQDVFERIIRFIPDDIDVCLVSSGLYSEDLAQRAEKQGWSYLSTKRNCVTLAQNVAIRLHDQAEYIYKVDEDIFVTQGCFETLMDTYKKVETQEEYEVGFVAPLIPINGYGHMRVLDKLGMKAVYRERFERPIYASHPDRMIENSGEAAKFFWGEGGYIPSIDEMNQKWMAEDFQYSICPIRFSIGFVLFKRTLWENMGMFPVIEDNPCMGLDEEQICSYCIVHSKVIVVAENTVVGHLAFGRQNEAMKEYYYQNTERFRIPVQN